MRRRIDNPPRPFLMLGLAFAAQMAGSVLQLGMPYLLPQLRSTFHGSLSYNGILVAAPTVGLMATLVAWGAVVDRIGERLPMAMGLLGSCLLTLLAAHIRSFTGETITLAAAGGASGAVNAASGRVVLGWFGRESRGWAMGIRQMAQPAGAALGAFFLPPIAVHFGYRDALIVPAILTGLSALAVLTCLVDPRRDSQHGVRTTRNPYRTAVLWLVHGASSLLVVPQFTISTFAFIYVTQEERLSPVVAGSLLGATLLVGALSRLWIGRWSDGLGSRLVPARHVSFVTATVLIALAAVSAFRSVLAVPLLCAASVLTASTNGLTFTATAELAGPQWAGRALGVQNTAQNVFAAITPAAIGASISAIGYSASFGLVAVLPVLAALLIASATRAEASRI